MVRVAFVLVLRRPTLALPGGDELADRAEEPGGRVFPGVGHGLGLLEARGLRLGPGFGRGDVIG
jgi:hypothetical protein